MGIALILRLSTGVCRGRFPAQRLQALSCRENVLFFHGNTKDFIIHDV